MRNERLKRSLAAVLAAVLFATHAGIPAARAADPDEYLQNTRVLGKGIESKKTHERLQLACVGKPLAEGSLERGCEKLQFVVADLSGKTRRVGPLFSLEEGKGRFKKQFKKQLLNAGVNKKITEEESNVFSRYLYDPLTGKTSNLGRVGIALLWFMGAGVLTIATQGFGWGVAMVVSPLFMDKLFRPVTKAFMKKQGGALAHATNVKTLNDRSENGWQLKPKRVKHKHFARALKALGASAEAAAAAAGAAKPCFVGPASDGALAAYGELDRAHCLGYCEGFARANAARGGVFSCYWGVETNGTVHLEETIDPKIFTESASDEAATADDPEDERLIDAMNPAEIEAALAAVAAEGESE